MSDPAYIAIAANGHVTLYWGDGTEDEKVVIWEGPRAAPGPELVEIIEDMRAWAEENGYSVIVPAYDLEVTEPMEMDVPEEEVEQINLDEVDNLLDDLYVAGDYDEESQ